MSKKSKRNWFKVYGRLFREEEVIVGVGHQAAHVMVLLLSVAAEHGGTGEFSARLVSPKALRRYFHADDYPLEVFETGIQGCINAGWLVVDGDAARLPGYADEYKDAAKTDAERASAYRARKKAQASQPPSRKSVTRHVTERDDSLRVTGGVTRKRDRHDIDRQERQEETDDARGDARAPASRGGVQEGLSMEGQKPKKAKSARQEEISQSAKRNAAVIDEAWEYAAARLDALGVDIRKGPGMAARRREARKRAATRLTAPDVGLHELKLAVDALYAPWFREEEDRAHMLHPSFAWEHSRFTKMIAKGSMYEGKPPPRVQGKTNGQVHAAHRPFPSL